MKKRTYISIAIAFVFNFSIKAQVNLVVNPSFELYSQCPSTADQLNFATGWSSYSESPDYFRSCGTNGLPPPENAGIGYQLPHNGNAHAGLITMLAGAEYREIMGSQLTSTLQIGTTYYFSFFVNFAGIPNFTSLATNKLGLRFSTIPYSYTNPAPINNFAHYYSTTILNDTVNWVQLKGSFVADSSYQYLALGNFFDDAHMFSSDTLGMPNCNNWQAYYFIDDVSVSTDSSIAFATGINKYNSNKNISLYPNPCNDLLHITCNDIPKQIEVFDLLGNLQLKTTYAFKTSDYILDVSTLSNGIYIVKINVQNQIIQKQIVVSKQYH